MSGKKNTPTPLPIHFPWLGGQEGTSFKRQNKNLMVFLIFGLPGAAYSGMHFPLDLAGLILYGPLLNAVGEAIQ